MLMAVSILSPCFCLIIHTPFWSLSSTAVAPIRISSFSIISAPVSSSSSLSDPIEVLAF
ncbi:hypothetical protein N665_0726s0008 [Sinapis alba]|nr:hypothetical protein N665_0726s0008 [Sinapis alba]